MQKHEKRRDLRLKRFWRSPKTTSSEDSNGYESPTRVKTSIDPQRFNHHCNHLLQQNKPTCSLPLLQVWPSQDSPRGEADGQSFIFPVINETSTTTTAAVTTTAAGGSGSNRTTPPSNRRNSLYCDTLHAADSGIDSVQASPSPNALPCPPGASTTGSASPSPVTTPTLGSPNLSIGHVRRKSSALLHPDHARLFALRMNQHHAAQTSPDATSLEDVAEFQNVTVSTAIHMCTASSSTTSSLTSVAAVSVGGTPSAASQRVSDPWLQPQSDREHDRRRSSTMTARYSLFDALDLEYALLRAAARGSVGPYSLSESIHKLTFTQSLAFPALARGLATKRRRSATQSSSRPLNPNESGLNTFAKVITAIVLVVVSFLVFLIVYKFVRT
ncbi:uncharacterized protein LOC129941576 [Eupeodes corollae]|uniref:uncharacterized protein LOC129941576 n=1 Tax=Eupeodes corollae TaxID=290404 RepID=UPI0024939414|nr:uncharacterized protein LOC129941576 [Eupeodes corollae]